MKNNLKTCFYSVKEFFSNILKFIKTNSIFCFGFFLSSLFCLFGGSLSTFIFESKASNEAIEVLTKNANNNKFNYTINCVKMVPKGNSDQYIFVDNELQEFQMRNQHYNGEKNFIFAGYTPDNAYSPFLIEKSSIESYNCSALLFESKYVEGTNYFDLPIVTGKIARNTDPNTIFILDSLARKICDEKIEDVIGKSINSKIVTPSGTTERTYVIGAVLDSNNNFGALLINFFGDNLVFVSNYNSYQISGACYFCGSRSKEENSSLFKFIFTKYKSISNSNRHLEGGYSAEFSFFDYDENTNKFILDATNRHINKIIEFEESVISSIFGIVGIVIVIVSILLFILSFIWNRKKLLPFGFLTKFFSLWIFACLALIIISVFYTFVPLPSIFIKEIIFSKSMLVSSFVILSWVLECCTILVIAIKN